LLESSIKNWKVNLRPVQHINHCAIADFMDLIGEVKVQEKLA